MCLVLIAVTPDPEHRLVLAANRDEAHERPTAQAQRWGTEEGIIAGKDLRAGGTWLGVTETGRVAAVTNFREVPPASGSLSRGALVTDFLRSEASARSYGEALDKRSAAYGGYNVVLHDGAQTWCYSNRGPAVLLEAGFHGLSNHLINTDWPKVTRSVEAFRSAYASPEQALAVLADRTVAPDEALPATGLPEALEREVSAAFIVNPTYGTRCSTWAAIGSNGKVTFHERSFDATGAMTGEAVFT